MKKGIFLIVSLLLVGCATPPTYNSEAEELEALIVNLEKRDRSSFNAARRLIKMGHGEKALPFLTRNLGVRHPAHRSFAASHLILFDELPPATLKALEYVAMNDLNRKVRKVARRSLQKFKMKEFEAELGR